MITDEAQSLLQSARAVHTPPLQAHKGPHAYAQALLERIAGIPRRSQDKIVATLIPAFCDQVRDLRVGDLSRTTYQEDMAIHDLLTDFTAVIISAVERDLSRKVAIDLATTLVPLLLNQKGSL